MRRGRASGSCSHTYLPVFEALSVDQEGAFSQQPSGQQPADAHPAQTPVLGQPAQAGVVPGHHQRFDTHDVAVTADGRAHAQGEGLRSRANHTHTHTAWNR